MIVAIGRFWQVDPLAEDYVYNSTHAFQENKMGMGVELEGLEYAGFQLATYAAQKTVEFENNVSQARSKIGGAVENRVEVLKTGKEKNNVQVANHNINQVRDGMTISESVDKIGEEVTNTAKEVVRDGADGAEIAGDALVVTAPLAGPAAPVVASTGATLSTIGTTTNIIMDVAEGDYKSATQRVITEAVSGGVSTAVKNAPGANETIEYAIDTHIIFYDNFVIPAIEEKIEQE